MQLRLNQLATQCDNGLPPFVLIFGDEPQQTIQALDTVREHALGLQNDKASRPMLILTGQRY